MLILKSLLSGGRAVQISEDNFRIKDNRGRNPPEAFVKGGDNLIRSNKRNMEFMYCIPDLEVFIDKTIKKCLLEYDLDANDTEAVLDDMEKAWPKSPPRPTENHVLRDCNDNSEKGKNDRQVVSSNQSDEKVSLDAPLILDNSKSKGNVLPNAAKSVNSRELAGGLSEKEERTDVVSNGKRELDHVITEGYRSDSSSPDVGDGKSQTQRHPKLKKILQQRYFEGQESCNSDKDQPMKKSDNKPELNWDATKLMSSNLDLLASAANIHTQSARTTEDYKIQTFGRVQEESEKHNQIMGAVQIHSINNVKTHSPELMQRISPSTSHSTLTTRSPEQQPAMNREKTQLLFQQSQNGHTVLVPQDKVVIRRELLLGDGSRQTLVLGSSSVSWDNNTDRAGSSGHYSQAVPSPRYQPQSHNHQDRAHNHNHQDRPNNHSDSFLEPFHYHGSRIANIIAEELQKDDDCSTEPQITQLSVDRILPADVAASSAMRLRSFSSPGPYKRIINRDSMNSQISSAHSHLDMQSKVGNIGDSAGISTHTTLSQLLPAHLVRTNTHPSSALLVPRLNPTVSTGHHNCSSSSSNITDYDDQPQDLSTKSRAVPESGIYRNGRYMSGVNSVSPATENGTRGYIPSTSSPLSALDQARTLPSPVPHKSSSPCNVTDTGHDAKVSTYPSIQNRRTKDQIQCSETWTPPGVAESQHLALKRNPYSDNSASHAEELEHTKRRRLM